MFEDNIIAYFDSIEPSKQLIERTITMSKKYNKNSLKISKKVVAVLVAAIILLIGVTGFASAKIANDKKGIVKPQEIGVVFDFSKASNKPKHYSDTENETIKKLNELGYKNVLLPKELIENATIKNIGPFINENSNIIDFESSKYNAPYLQIVDKVEREDMNNFWGTGDENTIGTMVEINGIDVCLTIQGADEIGYTVYVNYVVGNTIYCINYFHGTDQSKAYQDGLNFINSLE